MLGYGCLIAWLRCRVDFPGGADLGRDSFEIIRKLLSRLGVEACLFGRCYAGGWSAGRVRSSCRYRVKKYCAWPYAVRDSSLVCSRYW